ADVVRRVGLGVEGLEVAGPAVEPQNDARLLAALAAGGARLALEGIVQRQAKQSQSAYAEQLAACQPGTGSPGGLADGQHGGSPAGGGKAGCCNVGGRAGGCQESNSFSPHTDRAVTGVCPAGRRGPSPCESRRS